MHAGGAEVSSSRMNAVDNQVNGTPNGRSGIIDCSQNQRLAFVPEAYFVKLLQISQAADEDNAISDSMHHYVFSCMLTV
jgi:hypothetical protein